MTRQIKGFVVPIHRSLAEPILLAGAPRSVAIANGTMSAVLGLGLQLWIAGIVVWMVSHAVAVIAARKDPGFMDVLMRHVRHKGVLAC